MSSLPTGVLSAQLGEAIAGRRVRAAVFTTFSFDPGFFELQVLPALFDQSFSQVDKVRRIQMEDALGSVDQLAVYFDSSALSQDAVPAQLDYRRIDVHRTTGCFHPKLILLLVDELPDEERPDDDSDGSGEYDDEDDEVDGGAPEVLQTLIVGAMSANLTRAGWWENVECAHFDELPDKLIDGRRRCPFRKDLMTMVKRIRDSGGTGDDHSALELIHEFLLTRTRRRPLVKATSQGRFFTRLFLGQWRTSFPNWLAGLGLDRRIWNLEVISPYFDASGAGALGRLIEVLEPRETRVHLPRDADGTALVTRETYDAIDELAWWSDLPSELTTRGRSALAERMPPRRVHAKLYRLWAKGGRDLLIVGSVNATRAAHGDAASGNLEAAFLVDVTDQGYARRWWLQPCETEAEQFADEQPEEDEGAPRVPIDLALRYDWGSGKLDYRLGSTAKSPLELTEASGVPLFRIEEPRSGRWVRCTDEHSESVRALLTSTSFVTVHHRKGSWTILVREENMAHRPSLLTRLTPEEILEYWALLTPDQRALFIESRLFADGALEGLQLRSRDTLRHRDSLFDRFAGIYHSFGCLRRHIDEAIDEGRERDAEARLLGAKYDSLPSFLEKSLEREDGDPITRYVTFLCARQLRDEVAREHREFIRSCGERTAHLDLLLERLPEIRRRVAGDQAAPLDEFLEWYEPHFLRELRPAEDAR